MTRDACTLFEKTYAEDPDDVWVVGDNGTILHRGTQ